MLSKRELTFLIVYGMVIFPLFMVWLHLYRNLDNSALSYFLVYMGGMKAVYVGARGFDNWNSDTPTTQVTIDNGGH